MNPMTNVRNVQKLNERELERGVTGNSSWHRQYKDSAWVFIGGLPYELSEGDVICVFSQYGEVVNLNLVRDKATGKSKGFCFLCYEDQRSTILAVDNFNSTKLLGRTIRVDHCESYKQPKDTGEEDDLTKTLRSEGCAPGAGVDVTSEEPHEVPPDKRKKEKKSKKHKRKHGEVDEERAKVKKEKVDPGYDKYREKRVYDRGTEDTGHGATRTRDSHQGDSRDNYGSKGGCRMKVDKHGRDEDKNRLVESKRRSREDENDSRHRSTRDRVRSQGKGGRSRDKRSKDRSDGSTSSDSE